MSRKVSPRPLAPRFDRRQDTLSRVKSTPIAALIVSCANCLASQPIEIGPGPALGIAARGEEQYNDFAGWDSGDIVYMQPKAARAAEREDSVMVGYRRPAPGGFFVRLDFADIPPGELEGGQPEVTLRPGGAPASYPLLSRFLAPLGLPSAPRPPVSFSPSSLPPGLRAHWSHKLDAMEAFVPAPEWASVPLEAVVRRTSGEEVVPLPAAPAKVTPASVAVVAHANQSVASSEELGWHLYDHPAWMPFSSGLDLLLETHGMFRFPVNLHLSGSMLASLSWLRQDPASPFYPRRDGRHFLDRVKGALAAGWCGLVGGVFAEHIMPYFEGEFNTRSMRAYGELVEATLGVPPSSMPVMHIPERVMQSNSQWSRAGRPPFTGNPFPDILKGGYRAAYLDEVTHLHHWFYPQEHLSPSWTDAKFGRWAGAGGDDDEIYHHKVHRVNGVLCFVINDREDSDKFSAALEDGKGGDGFRGVPPGIKWSLLEKAASGDPYQLTLLFDDWEAFAGNCFDCPPNDNAARWNRMVAWMSSRPWIRGRLLQDVLFEAEAEPSQWVIDHGEVDGKKMMSYEWLQRATEHSYDNWYYGSSLEENFAARRPIFSPDGKLRTRMPYGDLADSGSIIGRTWSAVRPRTQDLPISPAELGIFAMSYETAWHDEDMPLTSYRSRNYQETFDRMQLGSMEDFTKDKLAGWALDLHGQIRQALLPVAAARWADEVAAGKVGPRPVYESRDLDLDGDGEFVMKNDRMFAVMERWGARLVSVFVLSPEKKPVPVVGVQVLRGSSEGEGEENSRLRISAFRDEYATSPSSRKYIDMPHGVQLSGSGISTRSEDGKVSKKYSLSGNTISCRYSLDRSLGEFYVRFGLSPDWPRLMSAGQEAMQSSSTASSKRVACSSGAWVEVSARSPASLVTGPLMMAGYKNRSSPMTEQVEVVVPPVTGELTLSAGHE